jgi:hypothetical protein
MESGVTHTGNILNLNKVVDMEYIGT